jgi:para-aminobenzoate synthetase/4-amino-4-deoxychorismate lyase
MSSVLRWHPLPAEVYALVEREPATVLLEHARPRAAKAKTHPENEPGSRLFTQPLRTCVVNEPAELSGLFEEIENAVAGALFAAGFFAYECGNCFEPNAEMRPGRPGQPLAWFGIYARSYEFDHRTGQFVDGKPPGLDAFSGENEGDKAFIEEALDAIFGLTERQYAERIAAIQEWIRAGDVYQLNFTAPLRGRAGGSPAALFARLSRRQPVEYGAFLHCQAGRHILCFSPELFFLLEEKTRRITTRPMKGTAPRGRTTREDGDLAEWLRNDPKNCAENVMIVDLLRNDLGRLCRFGSVEVESLFALERFRTLWQMTSTVTGELRPEVGFEQILRALFPCGSVTGAPKVRAMQLLAGLEEEPRGIYTGAIGYFSRERTIFNVAIRTLELEGGQGRMGVGSGIVIDSVAAEEFRECQLKAAFLSESRHRFPDNFSLVETMLWQEGFPLIELHLDRLEDSARFFDFICDRAVVKEALEAHAASFTNSQVLEATNEPSAPSFLRPFGERAGSRETQPAPASRKVRLLLGSDGELQITDEPLPKVSEAGQVRFASQCTDPSDAMLFHKTTHRPVYAEAFKSAAEAGFSDVLFLNIRGEVTEGAISNIFIEREGKWLTPPVECGLLAGVYRRHLLETRTEIEERVLSVEDLRQADAIYLTNAVRGLRRVIVGWES